MKMTPITSSNIAAIGYHQPFTALFVEFKNGKTFSYSDVSPEEHAALMASASIGKHFNQFIKAVKVGHEVLIAVTDDINTDDELAAVVDAGLTDKGSIMKSVADENFKNMKLAIQQCGVKDKVIAEQSGQIELLREALINVDNLLSGYINPPAAVKLAIHKARKSLEATKDGE